jgi:hypothetical protein
MFRRAALAVAAGARRPLLAPCHWRNLMVHMEPTPNPDSMKFVPEGEVVLPESHGSGMVRTVRFHAFPVSFTRGAERCWGCVLETWGAPPPSRSAC